MGQPFRIALLASSLMVGSPAFAQMQTSSDSAELRSDLEAARARINDLERRLQALENRGASSASARTDATPPDGNGASPATSIVRVGEAPPEFERTPEIAVLGDQGAVITRAGDLTAEFGADYTRADRNRAVFRGIELLESVPIGVFDINESHQDVLTASAAIRYGLTNRLEIGGRLPFVRRSDSSIITPTSGSTPDDAAATIDNSARGSGVGDIEAMLRYQLTRAVAGRPFFVGNLQLVAPTGLSPFEVRRDESGRALKAATGAGFWSLTPSVTAILPTDPVVLFGNVGYSHNFADDVDALIPPVRILRVKPGDAVSASAGIGVAFNERTSLNLGYAHSWAFGTKITTEPLDPPQDSDGRLTTRSRDLQIGRLLFGVTYRLSNAASFNWGVEIGATEDAPDLRTTIRIPVALKRGRRR